MVIPTTLSTRKRSSLFISQAPPGRYPRFSLCSLRRWLWLLPFGGRRRIRDVELRPAVLAPAFLGHVRGDRPVEAVALAGEARRIDAASLDQPLHDGRRALLAERE